MQKQTNKHNTTEQNKTREEKKWVMVYVDIRAGRNWVWVFGGSGGVRAGVRVYGGAIGLVL